MMVEPKLEGIAHIRTDCGHRPAKRADEPDLYRLLRHSWRGSDCDECDRSQQNLLHFGSPESAPRKAAAILVDRFRSQKPSPPWRFVLADHQANQERANAPIGNGPQPAPCLAGRAAVKHSSGCRSRWAW